MGTGESIRDRAGRRLVQAQIHYFGTLCSWSIDRDEGHRRTVDARDRYYMARELCNTAEAKP